MKAYPRQSELYSVLPHYYWIGDNAGTADANPEITMIRQEFELVHIRFEQVVDIRAAEIMKPYVRDKAVETLQAFIRSGAGKAFLEAIQTLAQQRDDAQNTTARLARSLVTQEGKTTQANEKAQRWRRLYEARKQQKPRLP